MTVSSSSRPIHMRIEDVNRDVVDSPDQVLLGPNWPKAGPVFPKHAAVAEMSDSNESPGSNKPRMITPAMKMKTQHPSMPTIVLRVFCSMVLLSSWRDRMRCGSPSCETSRREILAKILILRTFTPPPVEPAQEPMIIRVRRITPDRPGHMPKSVDEYPVDVPMATAWNTA